MSGRTMLVTASLLALFFAAFAGCGDDEECTTCVEQGPRLSLQPKTLDLGDAIPTHTFDVVNLGTGTLEWTVSSSAPWISFDPDSGSTTTEVDPVTISVTRTGIDSGNYSTFVVVTSNAGADSVEVSMRVPARLFQIEVKDTDGDPVEGLRISLWNLLPCAFVEEGAPCTEPAPGFKRARRAATTFWFSVESQSLVEFEIFDLEGESIETLIDEVIEAGEWSQLWPGPQGAAGTAVYEAVLTVRTPDGTEELFQKTVYPVLAQIDPEQSVVGFTDADGEFFTDDATLFPGLKEDLPPLENYDEVCNRGDDFSLEPVVYVYLQSADGTLADEYELTLEGSENEFILEWDPQPVGGQRFAGDGESPPWQPAMLIRREVPVGTVENDLLGNCPNPFN